MKLIVDIPEDEYKAFQKSWRTIQSCDYGVACAIKRGIPLDEIKAKINERLWEDDAERVFEIIDKHMAESEDKE